MRTLETARWSDWVTNAILRGFIRGALLMPYKMRVRAFGAFVQRIVAPLTGYDKRAHKQLSFIWPDMPKGEFLWCAIWRLVEKCNSRWPRSGGLG